MNGGIFNYVWCGLWNRHTARVIEVGILADRKKAQGLKKIPLLISLAGTDMHCQITWTTLSSADLVYN